ncbi:MAG: hypothetical protein LC708_03755, partial [Actinobacteria bacterium]|nr:hypothetical protein [Actinomycetota bacterium]
MNLSAATGAVISDTSGTATIVNDDSTYLAISDVSVGEGNAATTPATFTVTRSGGTSGASTVKYATGGGTATAGTDYTAAALTTLSFAAGETSKTVTVNVTGDIATEANETFNVNLSAATGGVISDATGTATIVNDDATYLAVSDASVVEGNSATTPATLTVTRSGDTSGTSTVKYATGGGTAAAGTDYTAAALTTLSFAAGETTKTVTVNVTGDTVDEVNETFNVALSSATGATVSDTSGAVTIVDDDGPITPGPQTFFSASDVSVVEGNSATTPATITVTRSGDTSGASTVKYATSGGTAAAGTDYTVAALTTLSFAAGETSKTVTVNVTGDNVVEPNETFNVTLSAATGGVISDTSGTATIVNDDATYLAASDASVVEGNSATT